MAVKRTEDPKVNVYFYRRTTDVIPVDQGTTVAEWGEKKKKKKRNWAASSLSWLIQGKCDPARAEFIKLWRESPLSSKTPSDIEEYLKQGAAGVMRPPWRTRAQPVPSAHGRIV